MFNTINQQEQPWTNTGGQANSTLSQLLGLSGTAGAQVGNTGQTNGSLNATFDPNSVASNPGYQFAVNQGNQATTNANTPTEGALSGANQKALTNFDVGTANTYENQYFNQFQTQQNNIFSRLSAISGLGQNAATQTGNAGAQLGTGAAQSTAAAGAATAGGIVGTANAASGGITTAALLNSLNSGPGSAASNQNDESYSNFMGP